MARKPIIFGIGYGVGIARTFIMRLSNAVLAFRGDSDISDEWEGKIKTIVHDLAVYHYPNFRIDTPSGYTWGATSAVYTRTGHSERVLDSLHK